MSAKFVAALSLAAVLGWSGSVLAAGSKEAGQAKAAACAACHGADGNSVNPEWPNLAGQHASYITAQYKHFRNGTRQNVLMSPMGALLSDPDLDDVAAYFASQTLRPTGETEAAKLTVGQNLYRAGNPAKGVAACSGCHGPAGAGNPGAAYPRIGGQYGPYLAAQLRAYKAGTRTTGPNQIMQTIAGKLSEEEIDAVASYLQGMR